MSDVAATQVAPTTPVAPVADATAAQQTQAQPSAADSQARIAAFEQGILAKAQALFAEQVKGLQPAQTPDIGAAVKAAMAEMFAPKAQIDPEVEAVKYDPAYTLAMKEIEKLKAEQAQALAERDKRLDGYERQRYEQEEVLGRDALMATLDSGQGKMGALAPVVRQAVLNTVRQEIGQPYKGTPNQTFRLAHLTTPQGQEALKQIIEATFNQYAEAARAFTAPPPANVIPIQAGRPAGAPELPKVTSLQDFAAMGGYAALRGGR